MPDLPLYLLQLLLLPDVLCYIFEILYFLFLRRATAQDSTRRLAMSRALDDPTNYTTRTTRSITPPILLEHPTLPQTPRPYDSATPSLNNTPHTTNFDQYQDVPDVTQHLQAPAIVSQKSLPLRSLAAPLCQHSPQPQERNASILYGVPTIHDSRNVSIDGNMNAVTYINTVISGTNSFMEKLLEKTIPGAAFNSSARDPPPRCHPGTRLAIIERCMHFIVNSADDKKMCWVVGAAGVGKSAIMQSVAESALPSVIFRASIFFFVNGRSDGTKIIVTLAYQLAVQSEPYRQFIEREITRDPSLLQSSMSVQFGKFVIEPFIHHPQLNCTGRILIIIDGLDECDSSHTQLDLLRLISDFCLTYSSSPLVWVIASRPEAHITSFFSQTSVKAAYEKEEIPVNSKEARADVENFLQVELGKIQHEFSLDPRAQWPSERDFWKLAKASGGLFVYAHTIVKYISDRDIGDPTLQLRDVLHVIEAHSLPNILRDEHPMALLDALYSQILSKVPTKVRDNMRKLLLALVADWDRQFNPGGKNFIVLCNWLGMTCDEAYAAIRHLTSVLNVPGRDTAHTEKLEYFHKSFIDYISDFARSGFSHDIKHEAGQLWVECLFRILKQAPQGIDFGDLDYFVYAEFPIGTLVRGPGTGSNISLTWLVDEGSHWDNNRTRLYMYKMAVASVADRLRCRQSILYSEFCVHLLATCFQSFDSYAVPRLLKCVFDKSCQQEFVERGLIHPIPVRMLHPACMMWDAQLQFHQPGITNLSDPWNPSCGHRRVGSEWRKGKDQSWSTEFGLHRETFYKTCDFCCQRLERQLDMWKTRFPDHQVLVLFTSTGVGFVEFRFTDLEDGESEWTYYFGLMFSEKERRKLGSTV